MASAAVASLLRSLHSIVGGLVVSAEESASPYPTVSAMRGDHPVPGRNSFAAANRIGELTSTRRGNDVAVVLISGGATSLIAAPLRDMREADLTALYEILLGSGLSIGEMNAVRKRFSRWSAGRLALALAPTATRCFAISDVPGDDLGVIGSGPCVPDDTTARDVETILERAKLLDRIPKAQREYLTAVLRGTIPETPRATHPAFAHVSAKVIGNNRLAVDGAAAVVRSRGNGMAIEIATKPMTGEASQFGAMIARQLVGARTRGTHHHCVIWGGETTVTLPAGANSGSAGGGRCQELALAAAQVLHDAGDQANGITVLAAGTDGRDGSTNAAGAIVDRSTWSAIAESGRDPASALASHESNGALAAAGALIPRRATGTNVTDIVIAIIS